MDYKLSSLFVHNIATDEKLKAHNLVKTTQSASLIKELGSLVVLMDDMEKSSLTSP